MELDTVLRCSLLPPDIEDDWPAEHLVSDDEEWRRRALRLRDVIPGQALPAPHLRRRKM